MPERKWLNRTGNQIDHKISTPPHGGGGSPKNRWQQACKMGENEISMGFSPFILERYLTVGINCVKLMLVFIFWWKTNFLKSLFFKVFIQHLLACYYCASYNYLPSLKTERKEIIWPQSKQKKAHLLYKYLIYKLKMEPLLINICNYYNLPVL